MILSSNFWEDAEKKLDPFVGQVLSLQEIKDLFSLYKDGNEVKFRTIPKKLKHRLERTDRRINGEPLRKIDGLMKYKILPRIGKNLVSSEDLDREYLKQSVEKFLESQQKQKKRNRK